MLVQQKIKYWNESIKRFSSFHSVMKVCRYCISTDNENKKTSEDTQCIKRVWDFILVHDRNREGFLPSLVVTTV